MRIALILNTRQQDTEFEIEYDPPHTIELIKHAIEATGHEYIFIEADDSIVETLKLEKPDLVFNRAEGLRGESRESHVPAILEMLGIPYVGANVLTASVCLNKAWAKKILSYHGVLTPAFWVCKNVEQIEEYDLIFPLILKPNEEGSSMGINEDNVVYNHEQLLLKLRDMLEEYNQSILAEQFILGREFSIGMLGRSSGEPEILPILEVDFSTLPSEVAGVFGQRAKTLYEDLGHYVCPANISTELRTTLERLTNNICRFLEVPDFARVDYRMDSEGLIYFLEINPLPGLDFDIDNKDISFYPYMCMKAGFSYDELIHRILESACKRYGITL